MAIRTSALILALGLSAGTVQAFDTYPLSGPAQACYSVAMVGYDSVINARMGVPPEEALELVRASHSGPAGSANFRVGKGLYGNYLLKVILDAYLWEQSPHSYAVNTFYRCAQEQPGAWYQAAK